MSQEVFAAVVGGIVGGVVAIVAAFVTAKVTSRTELRKALVTLQAQHRSELVRRQLDAVEQFWGIFDATCRTGGSERMLQGRKGNQSLSIKEAAGFVRLLEQTFNAKPGLYLSEKTRKALFKFRDFIRDDLIGERGEDDVIPMPEEVLKVFYELRKHARLCLRGELGTVDLRVAQEEMKRYEVDQRHPPETWR